MTLFLNVAKDCLIKNIQKLIDESNKADAQSVRFGALLGERDLILSADKRVILADLIASIKALPVDTDASNPNALVACVRATEAALKATRAKKNQAEASTEANLLALREFIGVFHTKLEALKFLEHAVPETTDPVFCLYRAIASYFATRLSDSVIKTNMLSRTLEWLSAHPSVSPKQAFLSAIDGVVEQKLQRIQDNLAGQKPKAAGFEQIKLAAVDDCLELLSLKHEALRHDAKYLSFGQPLDITYLTSYLDEAKTAINPETKNLEGLEETKTHPVALI